MKIKIPINLLGALAGALFLTSKARASVFHPVLAQAANTFALKTSVQTGLGVMFILGFLCGVVKIWTGADRMSKGDADGKMSIVSGIIIAGAAAIMTVLFAVFGMADGALTPSF